MHLGGGHRPELEIGNRDVIGQGVGEQGELVDRDDLRRGRAQGAEVVVADEDGVVVEAQLLVVGEAAQAGEFVGLEPVERVIGIGDGQEEAFIGTVEGGDVESVDDIVVDDVGVAAGEGAEEGFERLIQQDVAGGLVEDADLDVDRLDDEAVADGRVGIRGQVAAGAEGVEALVDVVGGLGRRFEVTQGSLV